MRFQHLLVIAFALFVFGGTFLEAGQFNEKLSVGDMVPVWENLPGTDGKRHSLTDFKDKEVLVIFFSCASCSVALGYEERIDRLVKKYGGPEGKVGFVALCASRNPADRLEKLSERAEKQKFAYPFLYDESQKIAVDFGATRTQEFYVINRDRKITFMGALDVAPDDPAKVTKQFVEDALNATLKGDTPAIKEVEPTGCRIRFIRERK